MAAGKKLTQEEFLMRAKEVHGDKYDYSKAIYKNMQTKVCVVCPKHGEFWVRPDYHLIKGGGCPKCRRGKTSPYSQEDFISMAREKYGNKYDYSKVVYKNMNTPVCIVCPEHGEFWQKPWIHLNKKACPECTRVFKKGIKFTKEEFVRRAREVHGDKYDYSKVVYKNNRTKVCIVNPDGTEFWQRPDCHLYKTKNSENIGRRTKKLSQEEFITRAREIHGSKYDYSKAVYKNMETKVCIICPEHGEFWQSPLGHIFLQQGCPKCKRSVLEEEIQALLESNCIEYEYQKTFDWLKYESNMFLDFFIPEKKLAIECQGLQHFEPVDVFGGEEAFDTIIKRDLQKKYLCEKHGIKIIYYSNLGINYPYQVLENKAELIQELRIL
jgi:tRNA splicing endonuclease